MRRFVLSLIAVSGFFGASTARAHHFAIDLEVRSGKAKKTAHAESAGLGDKAKARPVLDVKAGSEVTVKWQLKNSAAKATFKDVRIHFFTVKEEKLGQRSVPRLDKGVVAESALIMDFKPGDKTEGELTFTVPRAGFYLLRVETLGAAVGKDGHEHYAALDLKVQQGGS